MNSTCNWWPYLKNPHTRADTRPALDEQFALEKSGYGFPDTPLSPANVSARGMTADTNEIDGTIFRRARLAFLFTA
jgi:hypothetical protein